MYQLGMTDDQLRELGRLTATWSQIDYLLMNVIRKLTGMELKHAETLLEGAMVGSRITMLKNLLKDVSIEEETVRSIADEFCREAHAEAGKRNHLTHGMWGHYTLDETQAAVPASYYPRNKKGLLYARDLPEMVAKAATLRDKISFVYDALVSNVDGSVSFANYCLPRSPENGDKLFHFGYGNPEGKRVAGLGSVYLDLALMGHER